MFVAVFAFVEMAFVLGTFLFVDADCRLELGDRNAEFVVRDHAALTKALADNADEVLGKIFQHHHIRVGPAFESNQHDCSLFRYVGSTCGQLDIRRRRALR
jgi:hypothetical protein